jgi:hypothetical protein
MSDDNAMDSTLEYILTDACGFLLLCPSMPSAKGHRFLRPGVGEAYPLWEPPPPETIDRGPRSLTLQVDERGRTGRQVVKSHLPTLIIGWRSDGTDHSWD